MVGLYNMSRFIYIYDFVTQLDDRDFKENEDEHKLR